MLSTQFSYLLIGRDHQHFGGSPNGDSQKLVWSSFREVFRKEGRREMDLEGVLEVKCVLEEEAGMIVV